MQNPKTFMVSTPAYAVGKTIHDLIQDILSFGFKYLVTNDGEQDTCIQYFSPSRELLAERVRSCYECKFTIWTPNQTFSFNEDEMNNYQL